MYFTSLPFQPHLFTQSLCPLWETLASPFCESHCKKQVYLLPWNFSFLILTKLVWVALLCLLAESTSLSNLPAWAHSSPSFWTLAFTKLFWPQSFAVIYKLYSPVPAQPCHNQDPCPDYSLRLSPTDHLWMLQEDLKTMVPFCSGAHPGGLPAAFVHGSISMLELL
jgi:hypothetical protein